MERGGQGRGRREEKKGYAIIQPQHCLLLIVYMYSLGTSVCWPNIVSRIPKYISSTSALFDIGLLNFRGASNGLKNLGFYNRQEIPCAVIYKQISVAGRNSRNSKVTVKRTPGVKAQSILKNGTQT